MEVSSSCIEKMTEQDLPDVLAIEQTSFNMPFSENMFRTELALDVARLWVIKIDGHVVGYLDYWFVAKEIHVITLAVDQKQRNKKVASRLMEHMIDDARKGGAQSLSLDVRPSNIPALHLYTKYGFQQMGVRKCYYQDNREDALIMTLLMNKGAV